MPLGSIVGSVYMLRWAFIISISVSGAEFTDSALDYRLTKLAGMITTCMSFLI